MAKRLTDTRKWQKPFFDNLSTTMKLAWIYLCDNCDHAGVWDVNLRQMNFELREAFGLDDLRDAFGDKLVWISGDKIFIPSFVEFQYGELNPQNRAHNSVIVRLTKLNLYAVGKGLISLIMEAKDTSKDTIKDKRKEEVSTKLENDEDDFLSAYFLGFESFPCTRLVSKQIKLLWLDLYGDPEFILRTIANGLPRYQNLTPAKQNPEVFFTDQLKFDWLHFQKIQKQNATPGGLVQDL